MGSGSPWAIIQDYVLLLGIKWGFPKIRGTPFGSPHNKEDSILGV